MPPQVLHSSDSDSDEDVIQPKKIVKKLAKPAKPAPESNVEEDEEDHVEEEAAGDDGDDDGADSEASDEYTVEAIMDHKFIDNALFFHVKWMDYPNKKDWTWEPENHLEGGSDDILQEYYRSIGGRPVQKASKSVEPKSSRKRGRQSTGGATTSVTPAKSAKKPRTSIASAAAQSPNIQKLEDAKEAKWKPPAGNWEEHIAHIDTIEKTDHGLICYVQWDNGRKSQHDISVVYKKCPQRMLTFYEQHLVFKETGNL